jgi:hypothetical protein
MGIYGEKWRAYRRQNRLVTALLVMGLPAIVLLCVLVRWQFGFEMNLAFPLLAASWAVCWGYCAFKLIRFPCPRCGNAFLRSQKPEMQLQRRCPHCGLKLYEGS